MASSPPLDRPAAHGSPPEQPASAMRKVGAMNITPLAKYMAKKMYKKRMGDAHVDTKAIEAQIAASLLNGEPFEPIFEVDKRKVRIESITVEKEKLTARLVPAS